MGMPLLGMAISSFVTGISPAFVFDGTVNAQWLGVVIGAFLLVPLAALRPKLPVYAFAYTLYLPAVAAVVIVLCTFPATSSVRELAIVLAYGFYSMVCGVGVAASCAIANAREFPRSFVFATLVGTFCLTGIAGIVLGGRLDGLASNTGTLLVILTGLYGCWILVRGCSKAWHGVLSPQTDRIEVAQSEPCADGPCDPLRAESFDDRLARLSKEKSLSPRETEIVGYVGRGHSSVYVAKTLLISESTVYTHVRNVYRKLGISSREELIQLLNGQDASRTSLPARA
jgi:DNA-binding CsgD family transcriptional regulator